jgi:hypothetical protein
MENETPASPANLDDLHNTLEEIAASADRIAEALESISASLDNIIGHSTLGGTYEKGFLRVLDLGE